MPETTTESAAESEASWRRIVRNAASILLGDAAGEIFTGYAILLAATSLGPAGFGQLSEAQAFMDPFDALAGLGLSNVAITVAARRGGCDGNLRGTVGGVRAVSTIIATSIGLAIAFATGRAALLPLLLLISAGTLLAPINLVALLPFQYRQAIHRRVALPFVVGIIRLGTAYLAYWLLNKPVGYQSAALATACVAAALNYWWAHRTYREKLVFDRSLAIALLKLGWPAAALEFIVALYSRASYFLLHDAGAVVQGQYAAADRLMKPLMAIAGAVFISSLPTVAAVAARRDFVTMRASYHRNVWRVAIGCVALCAGAWVLAGWLLTRFAPAYAMAIWPFRVLSVGTVFMFLNMLSTTYIVALGRFRTIMIVAGCNLIVYLVLATQLIPRHGALGAALSTSLMEAINTIIQLWVVSRLLKTASRTTQGAPVP